MRSYSAASFVTTMPPSPAAPRFLHGIETETTGGADAAGFASFVGGGDGLGRILDDGDPVTVRDPHDRVHIAHLAEQVTRNDRLGAGRDGPLNQFGVDVIRARIDVDEDRGGAGAGDGAGCGEEGKRGGDGFVAGAETERHHAAQERVGAAGNADGVLAAADCGDLLLELGDLGAADTDLSVED